MVELARLIVDEPVLEGRRDMDPRLVIHGGGLSINIGGAPSGPLDKACVEVGIESIGDG